MIGVTCATSELERWSQPSGDEHDDGTKEGEQILEHEFSDSLTRDASKVAREWWDERADSEWKERTDTGGQGRLQLALKPTRSGWQIRNREQSALAKNAPPAFMI